MNKKVACLLLSLAVWNIPLIAPSWGATHTVTMQGFSFTPRELTIQVGDTVTWVNRGGSHDIESDQPLFKSPPPPVQTYSFTFEIPGRFTYRCNPHVSFGMVGTIIVEGEAENVPPTVSITSPADGATFTAPASVTLEAAAQDSDGTIARVEFFQGRTSLGVATASPYTVTVNLEPGTYTITAEATDDRDAVTASDPITITVNPGTSEPPRLSVPLRLPDGRFQLTLTGTSGQAYTIEVSQDLSTWETLQVVTVPADGSTVDFEDTSDLTQRFYRARQP